MTFQNIALVREERRSDPWRSRDWDDRGTLDIEGHTLRFTGRDSALIVQEAREIHPVGAPYPRWWIVAVGVIMILLYSVSVVSGLGGFPETAQERAVALKLAGLFILVPVVVVPLLVRFRPKAPRMVQVAGTDEEGGQVVLNFATVARGVPFGTYVPHDLLLALERARVP